MPTPKRSPTKNTRTTQSAVKKLSVQPVPKNRSILSVLRSHPILTSIGAIAILAILTTLIYRYSEQQKTLADLSVASKDLRVIYDKILASQEGNISSATFRNECGESSVEVGRGQITCGGGGTITLKQDKGLEEAQRVLSDSLIGSRLNSGEKVQIYTSEHYAAVTVKLKSLSGDTSCDGHYSESSTTELWSYSISCRKMVPDFLPGYNIEE